MLRDKGQSVEESAFQRPAVDDAKSLARRIAVQAWTELIANSKLEFRGNGATVCLRQSLHARVVERVCVIGATRLAIGCVPKTASSYGAARLRL
jgi:hypothetical protein